MGLGANPKMLTWVGQGSVVSAQLARHTIAVEVRVRGTCAVVRSAGAVNVQRRAE